MLETLETSPKRPLLSCADLIADYDAKSQTAFAQICAVEGRRLNLTTTHEKLEDLFLEFLRQAVSG